MSNQAAVHSFYLLVMLILIFGIDFPSDKTEAELIEIQEKLRKTEAELIEIQEKRDSIGAEYWQVVNNLTVLQEIADSMKIEIDRR